MGVTRNPKKYVGIARGIKGVHVKDCNGTTLRNARRDLPKKV